METIIGAGAPGGTSGAAAGELIKDSDTANFAIDVLDASMTAPVIVDFWAPWCGPCKTLGPALEKAVTEARGAVRLVKIDVDQNQDLAAQMRVQSIPAVYAFFQGRPIDGFVGAQPESQIKSFVKRLVEAAGTAQGPSPVEQALEEARAALEADQAGAASALFAQVLQHESESGSIPDLMEQVAHDNNNHDARFDLAMALYAAGKREAAVDELLELIRRNRAWNDEAARKQLLKFFEAWGPTDPLTLEARRRLSSLLFS